MLKNIRYQKELILSLKILVPVLGIVFLNWSIGTIFLYFCFDVLFIGGETILKIFTSLKSSFATRIGSFFRFLLIFSMLAIFLLIAMGYSFDGGARGNMNANFETNIIYSLSIVYFIEYLIGFIFSGEFKNAISKDVEKKTYYLLLLILAIMICFMVVLNLITGSNVINYVLGVSIIISRQAAEYFLAKK